MPRVSCWHRMHWDTGDTGEDAASDRSWVPLAHHWLCHPPWQRFGCG